MQSDSENPLLSNIQFVSFLNVSREVTKVFPNISEGVIYSFCLGVHFIHLLHKPKKTYISVRLNRLFILGFKLPKQLKHQYLIFCLFPLLRLKVVHFYRYGIR